MAQQKGIIKLKGTIGDITFYKTKDGDLAKQKTSLDGERIKNDPAFIRTRENGAEFGSAAGSGKVLRDALRPLMLNTADGRVISRLLRLMTEIKTLDTTSARGQRSVGVAMALPAGKAMLNGFNFNKRAVLGTVLFAPYSVVTATGEIDVPNFVPINELASPEGATHVALTGAWAKVDFVGNVYDIQYSPPTNLPIDGTSTNVKLIPAAPATGTGTDLFILHIAFFQLVNAVQYSLRNGAFNALTLVGVN